MLAMRSAVRVDTAGSMFTALFVGALLAQLGGGWLNVRVGPRKVVIAGTALLSIGIAGVALGSTLPLLLAAGVVAGLGQGALDISTNILVATVFAKERVVSAVNLLHFAFGAGAVVSPIVASAFAARWGTPIPCLYLAASIALANLLFGSRLLLDGRERLAEHPHRTNGSHYRSAALWLLSIMMFLYVGGEMGVGGWTTLYLGRTTNMSGAGIAVVLSGYWCSLTAGRFLGAILGTRMTSGTLLLVSVVGACFGVSLLLIGGGSVGLTVLGTLLIGVSYGPIFPTGLVLTTEIFQHTPSPAVSVVIALSSLGGMLLLPLQGILLERVSPLASVGLVATGAVGMLAALLAVRRRRDR